ncbi:MAG: glycosyltransferase [Bacteroidota bacterium]|nr:glycosyltransferase [Bacteroidota bacterium]
MSTKIPKKIHYCWFGPNPLPVAIVNCIKTWKKHNPDYDIIRWDESNSPMDHPFVLSAYESKKFAFVSDYVRLWVVYNFGGIYLDTDMYVTKSFNPLLINNCFFGYENKDNTLINAAILGAKREENFIKVLMNYYDDKIFSASQLSSFVIPKIITRLYNENKFEDIKLYNYDFFYPFPYENRNDKKFLDYKTLNTYAIHLWNMSWFSKKDSFLLKIKKYIKKIKSFIS